MEKGKRIGNPNTNSENIQSRYRNEIWHRNASNEKCPTTHDEMSQTIKTSSYLNIWRKGHLQILGNIGIWHNQTKENNVLKSISEEPENYSRQNSLAETLSKG